MWMLHSVRKVLWFQKRRNNLNMVYVGLQLRLCLKDVSSTEERDTIAGHSDIRNTTVIHSTATCTPILQKFLRFILQSYCCVRMCRALGRKNDGQ